ncbi:OsmC family protein [Streptococcus caviae]|uniref:OsmC family protein n=1 Tax=Streptococcus sp. 'caviae' TaxID=1915004 RepID=UPI00094BBB31|nr:OsmC family protein [Streptococcus sp. 'caviae']OLN83948.1 peroxiredoxin [Streptococcus sp. 'caviae']
MLETFKITAKKTTTGLQVEADARGFKFILDEPEELGGTNTGMNPVEALLCAFAACQSIVCASFAESQDFSYDEFWIEVEGDLDPDGFMGLSEARNGFQEIRYSTHFVTNEPQDKIDAFSDFMDQHCPVSDNLQNGVKVVRTAAVKESK